MLRQHGFIHSRFRDEAPTLNSDHIWILHIPKERAESSVAHQTVGIRFATSQGMFDLSHRFVAHV